MLDIVYKIQYNSLQRSPKYSRKDKEEKMKKIARRLLPLLICLVLGISLFSVSAFADSSVLNWDANGNYTATVNGRLAKNEWISEDWSHTDSDGVTHTGTMWYYAGADGILLRGWQLIDGTWYYFDTDPGYTPYMYTHLCWIDGKWYSFDPVSGALANPGWVRIAWANGQGENWYYAESDGHLYSGWKMIDGKWYWFYDVDNEYTPPYMQYDTVTPTHYITSEEEWQAASFYFFNKDGSLATGSDGWKSITNPNTGRTYWFWVNSDGTCYRGWKQDNGKWYYLDVDMCSDGTYNIDGVDYTFDASGAWVEDASASATGWVLYENGRWAYKFSDGSWAYGWQQIDGKWYYFDADGWMLADTYVDGYYLDASGAWVEDAGASSTGWIQYEDGRWAYKFSDGSWAYGWQLIDGTWYYFDADGWMLADTYVDGYYLNASGAWVE